MNEKNKLKTGFEKSIRFILTAMITLVAALVVLQVILRYILHMPLHYADELLTLASVWLYMLGAMNASYEEKHINARILEVFSKKVRYIAGIRFVAAIISIGVSAWLSYWAYDFLSYSLRRGKLSIILKYPLVMQECVVFVCFLPMVLFAVLEARKYYRIFKDNDLKGAEF